MGELYCDLRSQFAELMGLLRRLQKDGAINDLEAERLDWCFFAASNFQVKMDALRQIMSEQIGADAADRAIQYVEDVVFNDHPYRAHSLHLARRFD